MEQAKKKERLARFADTPAMAEELSKEEEKKKREERLARFGGDLTAVNEASGKKERKHVLDMSLEEYRLRGKDARKNSGKHQKKHLQVNNRQRVKAGFKSLGQKKHGKTLGKMRAHAGRGGR